MNLIVASIALFAAFMHASWNLLVKRDEDQLLGLTLMALTSAAIIAPALVVVPFPDHAAWPYLFLSVVLHCAYRTFLALGYRTGDLGQVYPVARGTASLLVMLFAHYFADERITSTQLIGVLLLTSGIISISFRRGLPSGHELRSIGYALLTAVVVAAYTLTDGVGARSATGALSFILWMFGIEGVVMFGVALIFYRDSMLAYAKRRWKNCVINGLMMSCANGLVTLALSMGNMALVSALRESSVILAPVLGALYLRERFTIGSLVYAVIILAGLILIQGRT